MAHIAEDDRAAARCERCGNIYTVNIRPEGEIEPIGVPHCRDCGGSEFILFSDPGEELTSMSAN